jgi:F-box and leucine-rich repeat protein 10/11
LIRNLISYHFNYLKLGRAKQTCQMRQCLQPMLPVTAQCSRCGLDGWRQQPVPTPQAKIQAANDGSPSSLME